MTLVPAYGRDYRSRAAVEADFARDRDFLIADARSRWDGKPINRSQIVGEGVREVRIRYAKLRRVAVVRVELPTCPACGDTIHRHPDGSTSCGTRGYPCEVACYAHDAARGVLPLTYEGERPSKGLQDETLAAHRRASDGS